jgi:hypothetical protein
MRRNALLAALCLIVTSMVTGQPNKTTDSKDSSSNKKPKPTGSTVVLNDNEGSAQATDKADNNPPRWYTPLERPDWWLVIIAALTGGAIVYQAKEMARATDVMRMTVSLQEAALMQWVFVQNWAVSSIQRNGSQRPSKLQIDFDISNESNFPLTMEAIFEFFGRLPVAARLRTRQVVLFPKKPFHGMIQLGITDVQATDYTEGILQIAVRGEISHIGVAKQQGPPMKILGNLVCGIGIPTRFDHETIS